MFIVVRKHTGGHAAHGPYTFEEAQKVSRQLWGSSVVMVTPSPKGTK